MSDLIERVAAKAGWKKGNPPYQWWYLETASRHQLADENGLTEAGLVFLLRELLDAGWTVEKDDPRRSARYFFFRHEGESASGDTLEEAVMLAYLAHKEG